MILFYTQSGSELPVEGHLTNLSFCIIFTNLNLTFLGVQIIRGLGSLSRKLKWMSTAVLRLRPCHSCLLKGLVFTVKNRCEGFHLEVFEQYFIILFLRSSMICSTKSPGSSTSMSSSEGPPRSSISTVSKKKEEARRMTRNPD